MASTSDPPIASLFFYGTLMSVSVLARVTSRPQSSIRSSKSPRSSSPPASQSSNITPDTSHTTLTVRPAILPGHIRHRVKAADYPAVVPDNDGKGDGVRGTMVTGLTKKDLFRLDIFEGDEYERMDVEVMLLPEEYDSMSKSTGERTSATSKDPPPSTSTIPSEAKPTELEKRRTQTYVWISDFSDLEDREWDYNEFVREKMWRWAGDVDPRVNGDYEAVDQEVARAQEEADPTRGRSLHGGFEGKVNGDAR
ncbi:MAG: hypothetical protein M1828_000455 [Chrysothrix sp. TS-e1954]|nr:MAG: hypothetical protein M1828_000455 [Chrysothrix sp. TS-e1954]